MMVIPQQPTNSSVTTKVMSDTVHCFNVASDLLHYPQWVDGLVSVEILEHDAADRPTRVHFEAESFGRKINYSLLYDYSNAPKMLSWKLIDGDIVSTLEGSYVFSEESTSETSVTYNLVVGLSVPLPGFVKRRAEEKILSEALESFKNQVESTK